MLTEKDFEAIVDAGCPACKTSTLTIETIVLQDLPLHQGELFGAPSWSYKGEDLVRGLHRIVCDGCKNVMHEETACPLCNAANGIARALETENTFPFVAACASCNSELLTATAYVGATVVYERKRAKKALAQAAPEDAGFHAIRMRCKQCHRVVEPAPDPCVLCGSSRS